MNILTIRLSLKAFEHRLVRDPFFPIEELEKLLDRRLELTFGPITHFPQVPLAEITIGDASRNVLNPSYVSIVTDKVDVERNDGRVFAHCFRRILLGQDAGKVSSTVL